MRYSQLRVFRLHPPRKVTLALLLRPHSPTSRVSCIWSNFNRGKIKKRKKDIIKQLCVFASLPADCSNRLLRGPPYVGAMSCSWSHWQSSWGNSGSGSWSQWGGSGSGSDWRSSRVAVSAASTSDDPQRHYDEANMEDMTQQERVEAGMAMTTTWTASRRTEKLGILDHRTEARSSLENFGSSHGGEACLQGRLPRRRRRPAASGLALDGGRHGPFPAHSGLARDAQ